MSAFYETKLFFIEALGYTHPLSFDEWVKVDSTKKSAVLYVQFYDEIIMAWNKVKSFYTLEEDGVSTMMQYLEKNVTIIENDPRRFRPNYIYRVAYNCLYCICHDIKIDRIRWETEISNIQMHEGQEFDLFDTVDNGDSDFLTNSEREYFWYIIESMGPEAAKVVNHILNGESLNKVNERAKRYESDPLRDIEVSVEQMENIISDLKSKLERFKSLYY